MAAAQLIDEQSDESQCLLIHLIASSKGISVDGEPRELGPALAVCRFVYGRRWRGRIVLTFDRRLIMPS